MKIMWLLLALLFCSPMPTAEAAAGGCEIYDIPLTAEQQQFVYDTAKQYDLSYTLCLAVMATESSFDPLAQSDSSAGIMQLNSNTYPALAEALEIDDFDVFDFEDNVRAGIYKLALERDYWRAQEYADEAVFAAMLIGYNRGRAGAERYMAKYGLEAEYVDKVLRYKNELESET